MMKFKIKILQAVLPVLAGTSLFLYSCQKDDNTSGNQASAETIAVATTDENTLESTFNDVFDDVAGIDDATAGEDIGLYGNAGDGIFTGQANGITGDLVAQPTTRCFTVTVDPMDRGVFPKTVTVDFGTGCETRGHLRKGKIVTVYTGRLHIPGNKAITTFINYSIDDFKIEGKHTLENTTQPGGNQRSFTATVENARITNILSGNWRSWNSIRKSTQVEGNGTPFFPVDDVFSITGNRNGENSRGIRWSSEVSEPLIRKFICRQIVKGVVKISVNNTVGTLDFGDGTCDNTAILTVNGQSKTLTLR
jgi:hypothetical protein